MLTLGFFVLSVFAQTPPEAVDIANTEQCYYMAQGAINEGAGAIWIGAAAAAGDSVVSLCSSSATSGTPVANVCEVAIQGFYMCKKEISSSEDCKEVDVTIAGGSWSSWTQSTSTEATGDNDYKLTRQSSGGSFTQGTDDWAAGGMVAVANSAQGTTTSAVLTDPLEMNVQFGNANGYNVKYTSNTGLTGFMSQWMQFAGFQGSSGKTAISAQYDLGFTTLGLAIERKCGSDIEASSGTISTTPSKVTGNIMSGTLKTTIKDKLQWSADVPTPPETESTSGTNVPLQDVSSDYWVWYDSPDSKKSTIEVQAFDASTGAGQVAYTAMITNLWGVLSVDPDVCTANNSSGTGCVGTSNATSVSLLGAVFVMLLVL